MHIVHVIDSLNLGGAERMLVELANQAASDGHRVSACVTRTEHPLSDRLDLRIELNVLGRQRRLDPLPMVRFARWIRRSKVDVLHVHGRSSFSLCAALRAAHVIDTPIVLHDHYGVDIDPMVPRWFSFAKRYCDAYVGVYPSHQEWAVRAGVPRHRTNVIGNALNVEALRATSHATTPWKSSATGRRLVVVGGIRREKAIDTLLEAIALMEHDVHLYVIGPDADPSYASTCRARSLQLGLVDRVTFLGALPDASLRASAASLAVHSSRAESGPLVLAEYAVLGVPFVSTRVGGIARTLEDAGIGTFVEADRADELSDAIDAALATGDSELKERARAHCEIAAELFDIKNVMPRWYGLYRTLPR